MESSDTGKLHSSKSSEFCSSRPLDRETGTGTIGKLLPLSEFGLEGGSEKSAKSPKSSSVLDCVQGMI